MEFIVFAIAAAVSIASAIMMIVQRNAMYSALFLVVNFFCLALFYVLLGAYFVAVVQVAVYAGAIMVLMLFVIMLLNVAYPEATDRRLGVLKPFGVLAALILVGELTVVVLGNTLAGGVAKTAPAQSAAAASAAATATAAAQTASGVGAASFGHTQQLAAQLFTRFLFPFEVTSIVLLAAILGAAVLARKRPETETIQAAPVPAPRTAN